MSAELSRPLTVIGLMSGTSVDAVDACCVRLSQTDDVLRHELLGTFTQPMPDNLRTRLLKCMTEKHVDLQELCMMNRDVGILFAETTLGLLQKSGLNHTEIDCIGSHGQTLFHIPPSGNEEGTTLQIGEPSIIAERTGIITIADFRPRDMAAGGHGAPLVSFADQLLFQHEYEGRCVQNIGGIANVTVLPPQKSNQPLMAFDTGPGNMMMDAAMMRFFGQPYDSDGRIAASGDLCHPLLAKLQDNPYFGVQPPKTTGRELFGNDYLSQVLTGFEHVEKADIIATLTYFTAKTIVDAYVQFVFPKTDIREMIVGGGGVYNATLMRWMGDLFAENNRTVVIKTHADYGVPDKYKEALAFAILAWANYHQLPNNIPSCTGARHAVVMGKRLV